MKKEIIERLNLYLCEHNCHNITVDVDKGVTPFMIGCNFTGRPDRPLNPFKSKNGKCVGIAKSMMYPQELPDGVPYPVASHEWYRPDIKKFLSLSPDGQEHVRNGGLLLRERTEAKPLLHSDKWSYSDEDFKKELEIYDLINAQ